MLESKQETRREKRKKWIIYGSIFVVFQVIVLTGLGLTVLRVQSPKVRIETITFSDHNITTSPTSFAIKLYTKVTIKNRNFGEYKFDNTTMTLYYQDTAVGAAEISRGKAKARKTRTLPIEVDVNSNSLPGNLNLTNELNLGTLTLRSHARLRGKSTVMHLMKRRKSGEMNCIIIISTAGPVSIRSIKCR